MSRLIKLLVCIGFVTMLIGCASTREHASTGEYVDDTVITTRVKAAIFSEDTLKSLQINVKTFKGIVQLSGFVDSARSAARAGEIASHVENVLKVQNSLIVK